MPNWRVVFVAFILISGAAASVSNADPSKELCPILQAQLRADYLNTAEMIALKEWEAGRTKSLKAMTTLTAEVQKIYAEAAEDRPLLKAYLEGNYSNFDGILRNAQTKVGGGEHSNYFICPDGKREFNDPYQGRFCARLLEVGLASHLTDRGPALREFSMESFLAPKHLSLQEVVERRSRLKAEGYSDWEIGHILGHFVGASTPATFRTALLKSTTIRLTASEESGTSTASVTLSLFDLAAGSPPATPYELYDRSYPRPKVVSELDYVNKHLPTNCSRIKSLDSASTSSAVTATGLSKAAPGSSLTDQNSQAPRPSSAAAP